jgi:hypothetical protein
MSDARVIELIERAFDYRGHVTVRHMSRCSTSGR